MIAQTINHRREDEARARFYRFIEQKRAELTRRERIRIERTVTTCETVAGDLPGYLEFRAELEERSF